jgi:hypothetical protein
MKEKTKKMWTHKLSSPVYKYVRNIYKGSGKTFGEVAAQARRFESEMDAWSEDLDLREDQQDE